MSKVKKNVIYNIVYQLLILIIPLITSPYVSRIIGVEGIGLYSYTYSIVYYFMMFILLGVNNYGNRTIAKNKDNIDLRSVTFFEIYYLQLLIGIIVLIVYLLFVCFFVQDNISYYFIEIIFILSAILDINWFFFGMEEFKKTVIRNSIIKVLTVILIFVFVKSSSDLMLYILIMASTTVLSQIVMWMFIPKFVKFKKVKFTNILKHLKPNIILFIPVISVSLYKIMDKIMLGCLSSMTDVGLYENAEKIINIPLSFINALGIVMLPRISNLMSKGKNNVISEYLTNSFKFVMFISMPMMFGLITISNKFAPIYFGSDFYITGDLIGLLSITIPFVAFANVLRTQYLIPKEKDNVFIQSVLLGAFVNLIINFIFIKKLGSYGACLGTIFAEISVTLYQALRISKDLKILSYIIDCIEFIFKSLIMYIIIYFLNFLNISDLYIVIVQILIGGIIYSILNFKYIKSLLFRKSVAYEK